MQASSFAFLAPHGPLFLRLAVAAERTLAIDPTLTLVSLRQLSEAFAKHAAARAGLLGPHDTQLAQVDLLRILEQRGIVRDTIAECFHVLRKAGNAAVHDFVGSRQDALDLLRLAYRLACWFHKSFGDSHARSKWQPQPYVPPTDPIASLRALQEEAAKARAEADAHRADLDRAKALLDAETARRDEEARLRTQAETERAEWEQLAAAYEADLAKAAAEQAKVEAKVVEVAAQAPAEQEKIVVAHAAAAAASTELDEAETRVLVDAQLRAVGWEVNSKTLRWSYGARPEKGKNRAIAEVPTHSDADGDGFADYVLYVGLQPYAVVEAKRKNKKVASHLEQAKRYSRGLAAAVPTNDATHAAEGGGLAWGWKTSLAAKPTDPRYLVPFLYSTNGRPYLRQLESESGVWFLDVRDPTNHPRALMGWHTPEALVAMRAQDIAAAQAKLAAEPPDTIKDALDLREYQVRAIRAVEEALGRGQRNLLVAMATGTGKTLTTIALIHRLLKSQRFRRVLFLVDRESLGDQADGAFGTVRLENTQTFKQNYDVMGLDGRTPAAETKVHVATVQGMVQRILFPGDDAPAVQIDHYDCIIIDESHRGYTLDREMSEGEHELRGFESYVSTYRRVLDHFDAVKIGLTATPAAHTREIFGAPVFVYSYPEAVADGWLVDHEPPIRIVTKLSRDGIKFDKGAEIQTLVQGGEIQLSLLPDEMEFDVADFNRTVITDGFNRAVAAELAQHLDPTGPAKTIIFCVDDDHAERLVPILKAALEEAWGPLEDDVVMKLTGAVDRPLHQIRRFKNETNPRIAVTVDLLSTGVDVPAVSNIVFLRRIKSRILYEQMLGRATRLFKGKEVFRIYDAVGLYDALSQVSDMKPVVKDVSRTTKELVTELLDPRALAAQGHEAGRTHADEVLREIVERLRRVVRRLGKTGAKHSEDTASAIESLEAVLGAPLSQLPDRLHGAGTAGTIQMLTEKPELAVLLERIAVPPAGGGKTAVIAPHADAVIAIERGYGEGNTRPEDYLAAFQQFIDQNKNHITALTVVCTRPRELTRVQLRELRVKLDAAGYSEAKLRTAFRDWKNQDIAATIVGYIRQRALGSPLVPYADRVDRAVAKVLAAGTFKPGQKKWLERIAQQLKKEVVVDAEAFNAGAFGDAGGWKGIDKQLDGRLEQIMHDLGDEVWNDEKAAQ